MDKKIAESIGKKTAFVIAMNQIESARVSKTKIEEIAERLNLSVHSAEKAYLNVTNSGDTRVDRRVKYDNPDDRIVMPFDSDKYKDKIESYRKNGNENRKKLYSPFRDISVSEMSKAILEMMTTNKRLYEILYDKKISVIQYYKALFEIEVYGTLFGKKVLAYNKFNKFAVKDLIRIYKYPSGSAIKNLDLVEISTRMRAAIILKNKLMKLSMSK